MKNETSIRIVSRLANSVFSFGINANYTQHSLKCNLSQQFWCQSIKYLKFFDKEWTNTPTRMVSTLLSLSEILLLSQIQPLYLRLMQNSAEGDEEYTNTNLNLNSKSGFSATYLNFSQASKSRSPSKLLRRSQIANFNALEENEFDEKDGEEEQAESDELEGSFDDTSKESSDNGESDSEEEPMETLALIDMALNPPSSQFEPQLNSFQRKSEMNRALLMKSSITEFKTESLQKSNTSVSEEASKKIDSVSGEENPAAGLEYSSKELSNFDQRSPILRQKPNIDKRKGLNEIRLKKVNFNEKIRITTVTNTLSADHVIKMVSKEVPLEWDNFDVYSGNNKHNIKDVISAYIKNFPRNIALSITNDRGYSQLQLNLSSKYIIRNLAAGKQKKNHQSSSQYQPNFSMISLEKAKSKIKKLMWKYFELLNQIVNSFFNQVQLMPSKTALNPRLKTLKTMDEDQSPGLNESKNSKKNRSRLTLETIVKYMFLGENIDIGTVEYLQRNINNNMQTFLNSSSAGLWRKCLELEVIFDLPGTAILTDTSIKPWLVSLIINMLLISRQFQIIELNVDFSLDDVLDKIKTVLEEAILHGRTYTIILDLSLTFPATRDLFPVQDKLKEFFSFVSLSLSGDVIELMPPQFLHNLVLHLWDEDYIKAMTYDNLIDHTKKLIVSNINFLLIVGETQLHPVASYLQKFFPTLHSKTMVRLFGQLQAAPYFEKSLSWKLGKYLARFSPDSRFQTDGCLLTRRLEADSATAKDRVWSCFIDFDAVKSKVKVSKLILTNEKLGPLVDSALCFRMYFERLSKQRFESAASALEKVVRTVPDMSQLGNLATIHAEDLAACLQNICLPRLLHIEDLFLPLLQDGLNLNGHQTNILALCHSLFLDEYSFVPIIYDPQGYSISFFKSISKLVKQEHSFQYLEAEDCLQTPALLSSRIESGCRVAIGISKMNPPKQNLVLDLLTSHARYWLGRLFRHYSSKKDLPPFKFQGSGIKIHNSFKFCVIFQKKADLTALLACVAERSLESFVRLIPFEENLNSLLINTKPLTKELETSKKQSEWIQSMCQHFCSDRHLVLFGNMGDFGSLFNLSDSLATRTAAFINPDETKAGLDYLEVFDGILKLNINDSSKSFNLVFDDSVKVTIQFKSYMQPTSPFDSTYEEKYLSLASKDLTALYQKLLVYFAQPKLGHEAGIDANYLAVKLWDSFDALKEVLLLKNTYRMKSESELKSMEEESKFRQALSSERVIRYIEVESPNFWSQLSLKFFSELSASVSPEDFPFLKFWLWSNHSSFDGTQISKFIYSNTFMKRQTLSPSMSASKYINTEAELEQRDIQILVKQRYASDLTSPGTADTGVVPGLALTPAEGYSVDSLKKMFVQIGFKFLEDFYVNQNPFEVPEEEVPEIVIKDESRSESETPTKPNLKRKMSDLIMEEQATLTEKRLLRLSPGSSKKSNLETPGAYKKSRFAQVSASSSNYNAPSIHRYQEQASDKKSRGSSFDGNRTPTVTDKQSADLNRPTHDASKKHDLQKLRLVPEGSGELSTSMRDIAIPGTSTFARRKNTDIDEPSPTKSPLTRNGRQEFVIQLREPEASSHKKGSDDESNKEIEADLRRNSKKIAKFSLDEPLSPQKSEENNKELDDNMPPSPRLSPADSIISPIRKNRMTRRPTEAFNRKISFRLDTFTKESRSGSPSFSHPRSPHRNGRGQSSHESKQS
jgi:hypothetical protein